MAHRIEACWLQEIVTAMAEPRLIPAEVVVVLVALIRWPHCAPRPTAELPRTVETTPRRRTIDWGNPWTARLREAAPAQRKRARHPRSGVRRPTASCLCYRTTSTGFGQICTSRSATLPSSARATALRPRCP